ncbi:MAG: aldehyde dehydrogenase family protein, partial [Acidobacteria bacterium]|nr:aldehyde dehydrogenase family protein [Acidobacteriota bacterium]
MAFLDGASWQGNISVGGWRAGGAESAPVIEPATGQQLAMSGRASLADVSEAAALAAQAQREWAALPFSARAAILRKAGQLFVDNAQELSNWIMRESGGIGPKADLEIHVASEECFEAAAIASHPTGEILR